MRILMTTDTVGGVWTFTCELVRGLLHRGCDVALVSFGRRPSAAQQTWNEEVRSDWGDSFRYEGLDIPLEWMDANARAYSAAAPRLIQIAEEFKADVLHSNQFCFGALPASVPKVITGHSDVLSWAECCRDGVLEESSWLAQYRSLVKRGLEGADIVVAPTQWMLDALKRHYSLWRETTVIPNGRTVTGDGLHNRKMQAVTAGRLWDEAKNFLILDDVRCSMPIFVAGEQSNSVQLEGATFLGSLSQDEILALFQESSIYLCTSRYEPFGLAPLEAALCGCAVLANDLPSLREVWENGALYFSDARSLAALVNQLFADPDQLTRTRQNSLQRAKQFTAERMTDAYLRVYQAACTRAGTMIHVA